MWKLVAIFLVLIPGAATAAALVFRRWWVRSPQGKAALLKAERDHTLKLHARLEGRAGPSPDVEKLDSWRQYWASPEFDRLMDTAQAAAAGKHVDPETLEQVRAAADAVRVDLGLPEQPVVRRALGK